MTWSILPLKALHKQEGKVQISLWHNEKCKIASVYKGMEEEEDASLHGLEYDSIR